MARPPGVVADPAAAPPRGSLLPTDGAAKAFMKKAFKKLVSQKAKQAERDALQAASSSTDAPQFRAAPIQQASFEVHPGIAESGLDLLATEERGLALATSETGCAATSLHVH